MSYDDEVAARDVFEAKHACKILRTFRKVPPQDFQALMVQQASTYYAVSGVRFINNRLVAERVASNPTGLESLHSMLDGLVMGYTLALGLVKPYYITYTDVRYAPRFKRFYVGKTEREVYEAEGLDFFRDQLPTRVLKRKEITEWFASYEAAEKRISEVRVVDGSFPVPVSADGWRIMIDKDKTSHF